MRSPRRRREAKGMWFNLDLSSDPRLCSRGG